MQPDREHGRGSGTLCRVLPWQGECRAGSILGAVDVNSSRSGSEEDFFRNYLYFRSEERREMRKEKERKGESKASLHSEIEYLTRKESELFWIVTEDFVPPKMS